MPFEKSDFVLIDYIGKVVETGEVFDTTIEEEARKAGLYQEGGIYEPRLVVIGEGWVLKALDESLQNLDLGKTSSVEISPDKAFGMRDPSKVRLYPLRKLISQGITPKVGMRIEVDRSLAIVRTIGSGRVQLDFNPPLAGKTLTYEVTVKSKLKTNEEKIKALIHRRIPQINIDLFSLKIATNQVTVTVPEEAFYIEGIQVLKRGIFMDISKFFEKKTVRFTEVFEKKEPTGETPSSGITPVGNEGSQ